MRSQTGKEDKVSKQINQLNKELRTIYAENSDEYTLPEAIKNSIEQLPLGYCWYCTDLWLLEMTLNNIDMTATMWWAQKPGNVGTGMATEIISKISDWGCNYMAMK